MKRIKYNASLAFLIGGLFFILSCSKHEGPYGDIPGKEEQKVEQQIKEVIMELPHFKAKNSSNVGVDDGNPDDGVFIEGWDFSNPRGGYNYSSPNGISYSSSSNTFTLAGTGGGNTGGTVVAGASALDMNYTFCFSIGEDVLGLSAFGTGAPNTGVSGVIGISGDFSKLSGNAANFSDVFKGLAYYIVYDGKANGNYDVVDWTNPKYKNSLGNTGGNSPLNKKCFALIVDFKNGRMFLSKKGKISVSGGTMNFNGEYFEVSGFEVDDNGNYDLSNLKVRTVPGFGAMGCS